MKEIFPYFQTIFTIFENNSIDNFSSLLIHLCSSLLHTILHLLEFFDKRKIVSVNEAKMLVDSLK